MFEDYWNEVVSLRIIQKKEEFYLLYKELMQIPKRDNCLEIGTYKGATGAFFSKIFKNVYSIDKTKNFNGNLGFEFIKGNSHETTTKNKIKNLNKRFDFIMIDGDHSYNSVKKDFEIYKEFAENNCIVAFHDIITPSKKITNEVHEIEKYFNELKKEYKYKELKYTGELKYKNPLVEWMNTNPPTSWGDIGIIYLNK